MRGGSKLSMAILVIAIVVVALVFTRPIVTINSGEIGIKVTGGKYDPQPLEPGFHFYLPFVQKIIIVDTKVRIINYKAINDTGVGYSDGILLNPAINVLDKRGLPVSWCRTHGSKLL